MEAYGSSAEDVGAVSTRDARATDAQAALDTISNTLIALQEENAALLKQNESLSEDVAAMRDRNLILNGKINKSEALHKAYARQAFVLVAIDGDGAIFLKSLIVQGRAGGEEAATRLRAQLDEQIAKLLPEAQDVQILVNLYLNKAGLLTTLNLVEDIEEGQFEQFLHGFGGSALLFNVLDCGAGKESADNKLRECMRFYVGMPQCRKIVFAGSHDSGYAGSIRDLRTAGFGDKLVLLRSGLPIHHVYLSMNLPVLATEKLFMTKKLQLTQAHFRVDRADAAASIDPLATIDTNRMSAESAAPPVPSMSPTTPLARHIPGYTLASGVVAATPASAPVSTAKISAAQTSSVFDNAGYGGTAVARTLDRSEAPSKNHEKQTAKNWRSMPCRPFFLNENSLMVRMWQCGQKLRPNSSRQSAEAFRPLAFAVMLACLKHESPPRTYVQYVMNKYWQDLGWDSFEEYCDAGVEIGVLEYVPGTRGSSLAVVLADGVEDRLESGLKLC